MMMRRVCVTNVVLLMLWLVIAGCTGETHTDSESATGMINRKSTAQELEVDRVPAPKYEGKYGNDLRVVIEPARGEKVAWAVMNLARVREQQMDYGAEDRAFKVRNGVIGLDLKPGFYRIIGTPLLYLNGNPVALSYGEREGKWSDPIRVSQSRITTVTFIGAEADSPEQ